MSGGDGLNTPELELWHRSWQIQAEEVAGQIDVSKIHRKPDGAIDREATDIHTQLQIARTNTIAEVLNSLKTYGIVLDLIESPVAGTEQ